jgi:hypothetical protein
VCSIAPTSPRKGASDSVAPDDARGGADEISDDALPPEVVP